MYWISFSHCPFSPFFCLAATRLTRAFDRTVIGDNSNGLYFQYIKMPSYIPQSTSYVIFDRYLSLFLLLFRFVNKNFSQLWSISFYKTIRMRSGYGIILYMNRCVRELFVSKSSEFHNELIRVEELQFGYFRLGREKKVTQRLFVSLTRFHSKRIHFLDFQSLLQLT